MLHLADTCPRERRHAHRGRSVPQRIRAFPDDDAPRLIFADWLDEQGDPRGRFIRVQLALARLPDDDPPPAELAAGRARAARRPPRASGRRRSAGWRPGSVFRRGFVDEVKVDARTVPPAGGTRLRRRPRSGTSTCSTSAAASRRCSRSPYLGRLPALTVYAQHAGEPLARAVGRCPHLAGLRELALGRNRLGDDGGRTPGRRRRTWRTWKNST